MLQIDKILPNKRNAVLAAVMVVAFFSGVSCRVVWNVYDFNHIFYIFSHDNIFHLLANVIALLTFRKTINPTAWIAAVAATFLPMSGTPTLGMSALLFAHLGTTWAPTKGLYPMCRRVLSWAIVIGLFPGVNMLIHIYALFLGYFMQTLYPYPKKPTRNH